MYVHTNTYICICLQALPLGEEDAAKLSARQKQIDIGNPETPPEPHP